MNNIGRTWREPHETAKDRKAQHELVEGLIFLGWGERGA